MTEHDFHQFMLAASEVAYLIRDLPESDRDPLDARIAQACVMFIVGEQTDAYGELNLVGYAADAAMRLLGRRPAFNLAPPLACQRGR